jgi:hypothetical protein
VHIQPVASATAAPAVAFATAGFSIFICTTGCTSHWKYSLSKRCVRHVGRNEPGGEILYAFRVKTKLQQCPSVLGPVSIGGHAAI